MESGRRQRERLLPPVVQFTERSVNTLPTLNVVASIGQWLPEELQSRSFHTAGSVASNDCSAWSDTVTPTQQKTPVRERHLSIAFAGKSQTTSGKKRFDNSAFRQSLSSIEPKQQQQTMRKRIRVLVSEKSSRSQAVGIDKPWMVEDGHSISSRWSQNAKSASAKPVASTSINQSYKPEGRQSRHVKKSDDCKSLRRCDAADALSLSSAGIEPATKSVKPFESAANDICGAEHGSGEPGCSESVDVVVTLEPVLTWTDVSATSSSQRRDILLQTDETSNAGAAAQSAVHREVVNPNRAFELPFDNAFENLQPSEDSVATLCGENITSDRITLATVGRNSARMHNGFVETGCICDACEPIVYERRRSEFGGSVKGARYRAKTSSYRTSFGCHNVAGVRVLSRRRCFSCDDVCTTAESAPMERLPFSISCDDLFVGGHASTWPEHGRLAVRRAGFQGDSDWRRRRLISTDTWMSVTGADVSDDRQAALTPSLGLLTDEMCCSAGALCYSVALRSPRQVRHPAAAAVDEGRLAAEAGDGAAPVGQSTAAASAAAAGVAAKCLPPSRPTEAFRAGSASYFSAPTQLCVPGAADCQTNCGFGLAMGQAESTTAMDGVESVDISSTIAVAVRGDPAGAAGTAAGAADGWKSMLNRDSGAGNAVSLAAGVEATAGGTTVTGELTSDTLGCAAAPSDKLPPPSRDFSPLKSSSVRTTDNRLALDSGHLQSAPASGLNVLAANSCDEPDTRISGDYRDDELDISEVIDVGVDAVSRSGTQQVLAISSRRPLARAGDDILQSAAAAAAVSAGVGNKRLAGDDIDRRSLDTRPPPPGVSGGASMGDSRLLSQSERRRLQSACTAVDPGLPFSDDNTVVVATMAECVSTEAGSHSSSPGGCDDSVTMSQDQMSSAPDDDDVDRKLASELERLKNLVTKNSMPAVLQADPIANSAESAYVEDVLDDDNAIVDEVMSDDEVATWTAEYLLEYDDVQLRNSVEQELNSAEDTPFDSSSGLCVRHESYSADTEALSLGRRTLDGDDDVLENGEQSADSCLRPTSAVDQLLMSSKVSY